MIFSRFTVQLLFGAFLISCLTAHAENLEKPPKAPRAKKVRVKAGCKGTLTLKPAPLPTPELTHETFVSLISLSNLGTYADAPVRAESNYRGFARSDRLIRNIDIIFLNACKTLGWTRLKTVAFAGSPAGRKFAERMATWFVSQDDPRAFRAEVGNDVLDNVSKDALIWLSHAGVPAEYLDEWKPMVFGDDEELDDARNQMVDDELATLAKKFSWNGLALKFSENVKNKILGTRQSIRSEIRDLEKLIVRSQLRRDPTPGKAVKTKVDIDSKGLIKFSQEG